MAEDRTIDSAPRGEVRSWETGSFVNAVIFMLKTGTPWRDVPDRYGALEDLHPLEHRRGQRSHSWFGADRTRFRGIARGSAMECGAIFDVVRLLDGRWAGKLPNIDAIMRPRRFRRYEMSSVA